MANARQVFAVLIGGGGMGVLAVGVYFCCSRGWGMWGGLWFLCRVVQCGETLLCIFQQFSAGVWGTGHWVIML